MANPKRLGWIGAYINLILEEERLPEGKLFRGGSIDYIHDLTEIKEAQTIINLRKGPDYPAFEIDYYHFPISNKLEKYHTEQREVRQWLNEIIQTFEDDDLQLPVFIHCLSGKDRTGIVVAAILLILGIPEAVIIEEYLLSEGEVHPNLIKQSIQGMRDVERYFNRVDLESVRERLLGKSKS